MKTTVQPTFVLELTHHEIDLLHLTIFHAIEEVPEKFEKSALIEVTDMMRQIKEVWESSLKKEGDNVSEV